jgi:biopolymer transport protein ExbD
VSDRSHRRATRWVTIVVLKPRRATPHQKVVELMEVAKKAGVKHLAVGVRNDTTDAQK